MEKGFDSAGLVAGCLLGDDLLKEYFDQFNATDEELYANAYPNASAFDAMRGLVPRFACPDPVIERTYYFRWWTYRKHLKKTPSGWVVTEFLPNVGWAGKYNTISCPLGHHLREGRWIRDARYLDDYLAMMVREGFVTGKRAYANWPAWGALERAKVTGDFGVALGLLADFTENYAAWEKGWKLEIWTASPSWTLQTGFRPERGLFDFAADHEGTEYALSSEGARPMVNAAMWAEATAIAKLADLAGGRALAESFSAKAAGLASAIKARLWNRDKKFFVSLAVDGRQDDVVELHGYAPFYFGMPLVGYEAAWEPLLSEEGFGASHGLTFPARNTPGFNPGIDYGRHECLWDGPSWPYATSIALTALYRSLQKGMDLPVGPQDFARLLKQYAAQHVRVREDGAVVPWIDENLHPFTGEWISRGVLIEQARRRGMPVAIPERGKDYNHSTFCDLVISGLCGIVPHLDGSLDIAPLADADWDWWGLDGVRYHGHDVAVAWDRDGSHFGVGKGLFVFIDGVKKAGRPELGSLRLEV